MKAIVLGESLTFRADYPNPAPAEAECLIRVRLAGICGADLQIARGYMSFRGVPGHEFVGTVLEGPAHLCGKRVVGEINCVCRKCEMCLTGLSNHCRKRTVVGIVGRDGAFAEFITLPERNLHVVPDVITDEEAVFVEPLAAAYQVLVQCPVEKRTNVIVLGAGRLGLLVAQVMAATGCRLVVAGRSEKKLLFAEKKGIQSVHVDELVARQDRDVVVDCTGSPSGLELALSLVRPRGTIVLKSTCADPGAVNLAPLVVNEVTLIGSRCGPFPEAIHALARKAVDVRSMITAIFPIEEGAQALRAAASPDHVKIMLRMREH